MMKTKICTKCSRLHAAKWKLCWSCREAARKSRKKWFSKNPEKHASDQRQRMQANYQRGRDWVHTYLKIHPCVDCGEADYRVLEFDHVRGKKKKAISAMRPYAIETIEIEVAKCDIRCANCHKRRHFDEGYVWPPRV